MAAFAERTVPRAPCGVLHCRRPGATSTPGIHLDLKGPNVITLGVILLILGFVLDVSILWTIGIILLVIGAVLFLLGAAGRAVGGRKHYY